MKARLAYYYGWTDKEILKLKWSTFRNYLKCTESFEAQEAMTMIQASAYPNLKSKKDRDKIFNSYSKMADIIKKDNEKVSSIEDFANILSGKING
jgi:hypothetical protein